MRRTLTVLVASAALLVPATAASAAKPVSDGAAKTKTNASCSNGKGGNGGTYSGNGNTLAAATWLAGVELPPGTITACGVIPAVVVDEEPPLTYCELYPNLCDGT